MILKELLSVGSPCFVLLYPTSNPEFLFPASGVVEDVEMDPVLPKYAVRVTHVDETPHLVRKHFDRQYWSLRKAGWKTTKQQLLKVPSKHAGTTEQYVTWVHDQGYLFAVDYPMAWATRDEMRSAFMRLHEHFVDRTVRRLRDLATRKAYEGGRFWEPGDPDLAQRLWRTWADRFASREEFDRWVERTFR